MEPNQPSKEILHDFSPRIRIYKDGRVERLIPDTTVPPSFDPTTNVHSKDITISSSLTARIYIPKSEPETTKLPLLIYFHGGAFCLFSSSSSRIHDHLNLLVTHAHVIAVSVNYRLAPEHPIPACYDDAWAAACWATGPRSDPWIADRADFGRVYLAGESAGANIAHDVLTRAGPGGLLGSGVKVLGAVLGHPFFGDGTLDPLWGFFCPVNSGPDDPRLNPMADPARFRESLGCRRMMVCVDKDDWLRERGVTYHEVLKGSGWEGEMEFVETEGGGHVFHVWNPECDWAVKLRQKIASFINKRN